MTTYPPNHKRTIYNPVQRDSVTFLETSAESGGRRTLVDVSLEPGGGNGLHYHTRYAEYFEVLEGTLGIGLEDHEVQLQAGETLLAAPYVVHRFFNSSDKTVRFRTELTPGDAGFEHMLMITYGLARDGQVTKEGLPKDLLTSALIVEMSGLRFVGPLRLMQPVFSLLAKVARGMGLEQRLLARYGVDFSA